MKIVLTIVVTILVLFGVWKLIQTKPDANIPQATVSDTTNTPTGESGTDTSGKQIDNSNVKIAFIGFGPGKKHLGSFSDVRSNLSFNVNGDLKGDVVVGMESLATDTKDVTAHLKTGDFFDVAKYPNATFTVKGVNSHKGVCAGMSAEDQAVSTCLVKNMTGIFTIHGVTKDVTFPITETEDSMNANFTINMKEFGIDQTFANETIELQVTAPLK
jgi:polyisoprenoid-binding protein YceI